MNLHRFNRLFTEGLTVVPLHNLEKKKKERSQLISIWCCCAVEQLVLLLLPGIGMI
jgi:hypothetical protein